MTTIRKNERSWAIELISQINQFSSENDLIIKRAGGESTISEYRGQSMFPDVILYGDSDLSSILQGWELKMPDVSITDADFVGDAQRKAKALSLNSCVIWNFTYAKLYVYNKTRDEFEIKQEWQNRTIKTRDDVQLYKTKWENTLKSVLVSVNEYLVSGNIKRTSIKDVLTKTSISNLVNENKLLVANEIKESANHDSVMESFLSTWWNDIKTEYERDEVDKYAAYAKCVIINWANRIIFAHLIKRRQVAAFAIDRLDYNSTPKDGNQVFIEITQKSDFFNIFNAFKYNEFIPVRTWASLIELSLFLKNSPIQDFDQKILQQVLEGSVNISKRLVNGQYPTPLPLAAILSRMTIHDVSGHCFDCCCGTGTIPSFVIDYKKTKIGATAAMATTWASDKFQLPLQIANLAMTNYDTINKPCLVFQRDILTLQPEDEVEIVNPETGEIKPYNLPLFDAIVSNLPFVKSREISEDDVCYTNRISEKYHLSRRSDFSYYIALHLSNLVKKGGYIGIVLSNSFLGTEAGSIFFEAIKQHFDDIRIHISGNGRWFMNADIVTVLLIMRKKDDIYLNKSISFFTWKKNLDVIASRLDYMDSIVNSSILDKVTDGNVIERVNYTDDELDRLKNLNVSYNSLFSDLKWLLNISDCLIPVNEYLTVFRGSRRGWDAMFYPQGETGIEHRFLKDVLINARNTDCYDATTDRKAFCCNLGIEELESYGYYGALRWIKRFENETNGTGKLLPEVLRQNGAYWYELTTNEIAELFTMMNPDNRMFYAKFSTPTFVNQRLIGLKRKKDTDDLDLLHALLNSILSLFYIEAVGFGRGLGVLDINKDSVSNCYMLNPALLTPEQSIAIKESFSSLKERGIVDFDQDMDDPIRQKFDLTVLRAFKKEEYYFTILNSIKSMRKIRKAVNKNNIAIPMMETAEYDLVNEKVTLAAENNNDY